MLPHERLDVYRRAIELLALSSTLQGAWSRGHPALADQLNRAVLSIPLNIAEGVGKTSARDRARFHAIARGSAMECAAIFDVARVLKLSDEEALHRAKELTVRIVAMLTRMCR